MSLSVSATPEQLASMTCIADVCDHAEVTTTEWNSASEPLGNVTPVRVFGLGSFDTGSHILGSHQAFQGRESSPRQLTSVEANSWQSCGESAGNLLDCQMRIPFLHRLPCHNNCCCPKETVRSANRQSSNSHRSAGRSRRPHSQRVPQVDMYFQNHIDTVGVEPLQDEEPYADFAVLTPFGRRMQLLMKLGNWIRQSDGTFKAIDAPGPPDFEWFACFTVYRANLHRALVSDASRDPSPAAFTTRSAASWRFRDGAMMGVLYARSHVAHTDPSSVVDDYGICHTLCFSQMLLECHAKCSHLWHWMHTR